MGVVCSSRTRSRARRPISSACAGSAINSRYAATASSAFSTTSSSPPGSNQRSIPLVRVRDDRGAGGGELERTSGRRSRDRRVWSPRHVQVDPRRGDRACEDVERNVAQAAARLPCRPGSRDRRARGPGRERARRLADHRLHPVAPELVAVAVEEDVDLLLDVLRREELGVGPPVERLGAPCAELEQAPDPPSEFETTRSYSHGSAPWYGLKPVSIPRTRAGSSGRRRRRTRSGCRNAGAAHRDAREVRHRHREDDHRVRLLRLDQTLEMPFPAWRDPARDRLARQLVEGRLLGARLGAAEVAVALHAREHVPHGLVGLALAVRRVGSGLSTTETRPAGRDTA